MFVSRREPVGEPIVETRCSCLATCPWKTHAVRLYALNTILHHQVRPSPRRRGGGGDVELHAPLRVGERSGVRSTKRHNNSNTHIITGVRAEPAPRPTANMCAIIPVSSSTPWHISRVRCKVFRLPVSLLWIVVPCATCYLPHRPYQIERPAGRCATRSSANRSGSLIPLSRIVDQDCRRLSIAPGVAPPIASAGCALPLSLGRQSQAIASWYLSPQLRIQPAAECDGLIPCDAHHWLSRSTKVSLIPTPWLRLLPIKLPLQAMGRPPAPVAIATSLHKVAVLCHRHWHAPNPEVIQTMIGDWIAFFPATNAIAPGGHIAPVGHRALAQPMATIDLIAGTRPASRRR